jgi:Na+/proline symporter/signal transduction histidine kinase
VLQNWMVVLAALVYLTALFAIAHVGENRGRKLMSGPMRPVIFALSLGVYCTSWTFLGSVGLSSRTGYDFLPIYIGPVIVVALFWPFIGRIVRLAKENNISSIADFAASRYGKSQTVAAAVTLICVIGVVPYVALQLKAISTSLEVFLATGSEAVASTAPILGDMALLVALILAFFAIIFGTRQVDTTEHQDGLMIAIAVESGIKLVAFLAAGAFVMWGLFDGPVDLFAKAAARPEIIENFSRPVDVGLWLTMTLLAAFAILMLPRQFHVTVIENRDPADVRRAAWMFPAYLVLINLFVIPIAVAGLLILPAGGVDRDLTLIALPLREGAGVIALVVLIGTLSAATAMVIVECVALAIMISNELFMPLAARQGSATRDMAGMILFVRRAAIVLILLLSYAYYRAAGDAALASIGLLAFAAIAQIGPALIGGMIWQRATASGAVAGLTAGIAVWTYTLLIPSFGADIRFLGTLNTVGPAGIGWLKPSALFGIEAHPLVHGVFASLAANILCFVGMSLVRPLTAIEKLQAGIYLQPGMAAAGAPFRFWRAPITIDDLRQTVARYLGAERTDAAFHSFATTRGRSASGRDEADAQAMRFAEHLLASAIGASSSRLVLSLLLKRRNLSSSAALEVVDEASAAVQQNRALLQHALDHAQQGVTVVDKDLRLLACNQAFREMFQLPAELTQPGTPLGEIITHNAERGLYGDDLGEDIVATRIHSLVYDTAPVRLRLPTFGVVIDIRSNNLPDGGRITTYTDITDSVAAEEALERANETLERRVKERTEELVSVNSALSRAKADAEEANLSKTRFLAAASHDILQPLNAARLYTSSLVERVDGAEARTLAANADSALDSVEEILTALLDISRLDSGALKPDIGTVAIGDIFRQLAVEFAPVARAKGLRLAFVPCSLSVRTDRRLLRRMLQNLVSNAIKYTPTGRVLVGCRRRKGRVSIEVRDTGIGIPANRQKQVFREFQRLDQGALIARGLGLGLSIVERIAKVLDHKVTLVSTSGKGTLFAIETAAAPAAVGAAGSESAAPSVAARPSALTGLEVLCIDNEAAILDGMRILLTGWGCNVIAAPDAQAAVKLMRGRQRPPDAVVADFHLDRGNGLGAIRHLRRTFGPGLRAALLTADRTAELRSRAADVDVTVLNKPVKPAALRAWLGQAALGRQAAE